MPETLKNPKVRDIIEIDEELCDGCGDCILSCAEGALALVDGKAKLVSDVYCDGLGACLGQCHAGALRIIRRESADFDEDLVRANLSHEPGSAACPGAASRRVAPQASLTPTPFEAKGPALGLTNWPIQMKLAPPNAPFFDTPVLVVAADCGAYACPSYHSLFLSEGYPLVLGCPKLDDVDLYIIKISEILKANPQIRELRVPIMEVPCCRGLIYAVVRALERSGRDDTRVRCFVISSEGRVEEEFPQDS